MDENEGVGTEGNYAVEDDFVDNLGEPPRRNISLLWPNQLPKQMRGRVNRLLLRQKACLRRSEKGDRRVL